MVFSVPPYRIRLSTRLKVKALLVFVVIILIIYCLNYMYMTVDEKSTLKVKGSGIPVKTATGRPMGHNTSLYDIDIMSARPITFLQNYKNPCWYEPPRDNSNTADDGEDFRCLPYFFIAGFAKCATTDLYDRLTAHPQIIRPSNKEFHWWNTDRFGASSSRFFASYLEYLQPAANEIRVSGKDDSSDRITVDRSGATFWKNFDWKNIVGNDALAEQPRVLIAHCIRHLLPGAKFIVMMRNPADRMWSDYLYFTPARNLSAEDFHGRVVQSVEKFNLCTATREFFSCVYDKQLFFAMKVRLLVGLYGPYVEQFLKVFPPDQCLFLQTEYYSANMRSALKTVYQFLDVEPLSDEKLDEIVAQEHANQRYPWVRKAGHMWNSTRHILDQFYEASNKLLAEILKDEKFLWKTS